MTLGDSLLQKKKRFTEPTIKKQENSAIVAYFLIGSHTGHINIRL